MSITLSGERVNLNTYPPVCLPKDEIVLIDQKLGHIFGRFFSVGSFFLFHFSLGWGQMDEHSAVTLQEAKVFFEVFLL